MKASSSHNSAGGALARYETGEYFRDPQRHSGDAEFKASNFLSLLDAALEHVRVPIESYADVGSGSGHAARLVASGLRERGFVLRQARGYDVSPHVQALAGGSDFEFVNADFCESGAQADLVTLFDVVEHVPDPVTFIKSVAARCLILGLHLPLDDSLNASVRDLFRSKIADPGHLFFMDGVSALNLLTLAGLRVIDYRYTFGFRAPSGRASGLARATAPLRAALARVSPWLLSKTLGGASLMVIALTPSGAGALRP